MSDTESQRRSLLEAVAAGTLGPAEAAERLAALDSAEGEVGARPAAGRDSGAIRRLRIASTGHPVRVLADSRLTEPAVEGPHATRREGDTLVIQSEVEEASGYFVASVPTWPRRADPINRMWRGAAPLIVRTPPEVALDIDITATSLVVQDVRGPISLAVAAGSARVTGFSSPVDIDVSAGSVSASGLLDGGESRVRCNAGSVKLHLSRGSSVRVKGLANAGRLGLPRSPSHAGAGRGPRGGPRGPFRPFGMEQESVVGDGAGLLDIEVTTGSVVVRADS